LGILTGKDVFSSKFITAIITDSSRITHFVPIKHTIGRDYFLADIDHKIYCFKIEGSRIFTWQKTLAKSFRMLFYDTSHYMPVSQADVTELVNLLTTENLPKVNKNLWKILKVFAVREKAGKDFEPHDLLQLQAEVTKNPNLNKVEVKNMITFLGNLKKDKISTPVKRVAEFLEGDLITTDPGFIGEIIGHVQRVDNEDRKITNSPVHVKKSWAKMVAVAMVIGIAIFGIYYLYETGAFEDLPIPGLPSAEKEKQDIMAEFGTPEELKAAIDRGEIDKNDLPKDIQRMVDSLE